MLMPLFTPMGLAQALHPCAATLQLQFGWKHVKMAAGTMDDDDDHDDDDDDTVFLLPLQKKLFLTSQLSASRTPHWTIRMGTAGRPTSAGATGRNQD